MSIRIGDRILPVSVFVMTESGPKKISTQDLFAGKKILLFALPGAYTPTCSASHLPGYVMLADTIKSKGVDTIICMTVNDPYVMDAWGKSQNVGDKVMMISDGNADFTQVVGLANDGSAAGMGLRSRRYAMIIEDGRITELQLEKPRAFEVSSATSMLKLL